MSLGVFCLEGEWWGNYKKPTTVEPGLQLLKVAGEPPVNYIHRNVATVTELEFYVRQWILKKHDDYPILYLAFHGSSGFICVGDQRRSESKVGLDQLEELIDGAGAGRLIYFGSCSTLDFHGNLLNGFIKRTGLEGVVGYKTDVYWMDSMLVDLSMLGALGGASSVTARAINSASDATRERMGKLCDTLKFKVATG